MPLWNIFHSPRAFPYDEKKQLAERITSIYTAFYVCVLFHKVEADSFFNAGKQTDNFVRIVIEHVVGRLERPEEQQHFLNTINDAIAPFVRDKGFDWEFQIDETAVELWSVQGFVPPPAPSAALQRWARENRPSQYSADEIKAKS